MDFTDIVKTIAPTAATLLLGPTAGLAAKFLADKIGVPQATVDAVSGAVQNMTATPEGRIRLAEIDADLRKYAMGLGLEVDRLAVQTLEIVNKTIQTEAMGGDWLQRNHHAIESLGSVAMMWCVYFLLPIFGKAVPDIPGDAWLMLGAILGVTAWQRGKANIATAEKG